MAGSRSLGVLTLDLVARTGGFVQGMDKAQRRSAKWRRQVERDLKSVGRTFATAAAAAAAGLGAMVVQTTNSAREIRNLAAIGDTSTQTFQRMAYGASRVGIQQDKLADIFKDVNDKVGDFLFTGGGPLKDFFEQIAPRVGVTADEFARLSGPEALQLYVDSLEKAGLSERDMAFFMEAIASDATALIPLLRDNGAELKRLGDEAERTGNVFSEMEFEQLEQIKRGMDELTGAATGMKNEVVLAALPAINDLVTMLSSPDTLENAKALGGAIVSTMNAAVRAIDTTVSFAKKLGTELGVIVAGIGGLELQEQRQRILDALENPSQRLRFFGPGGLVEYFDEQELRAELARIDGMIAASASPSRPAIGGPATDTPGRDDSPGAGDPSSEFRSGLDSATRSLYNFGETLDQFTPKLDESIQGILGRAGEGATIDESGQIRDAFGNRNNVLQRELEAAIKTQRADFTTQNNLQAGLAALAGNPAESVAGTSGRSVWSTALNSSPTADVVRSVSRSGGGSATKDRGRVTVKIVDGPEGEVEGQDAFIKQLADALSGTASSV